jgi:DNA-binding NtrC family response regulator
MESAYSFPPKRRVVIIEDDPDFAERLTKLLTSLGHEVVVRLDSSASETYEIRDADVVFIDLLMPHVSGVQVLEQLDRQNLRSPIVLMSSNDQFLRNAEDAMKKLQLWLLGVLYKPFRLVDVKAMLEGV